MRKSFFPFTNHLEILSLFKFSSIFSWTANTWESSGPHSGAISKFQFKHRLYESFKKWSRALVANSKLYVSLWEMTQLLTWFISSVHSFQMIYEGKMIPGHSLLFGFPPFILLCSSSAPPESPGLESNLYLCNLHVSLCNSCYINIWIYSS